MEKPTNTTFLASISTTVKLLIVCCLSFICNTAFSQTWTGSVSTAWETAENWSTGVIPTTATDVIIPTAPSGARFPTISTGTQGVKSLTIQTGATVLQTGGTLQLARDWKNSGTYNASGGTVQFVASAGAGANYSLGSNNFYNVVINSGIDPKFDNEVGSFFNIAGDYTNNNSSLVETTNCTVTFSGTGNQTIFSAATGNDFGQLTINKPSGTLSLASNIRVAGNLTLTAGTFSTSSSNYSLTVNGSAAFNGGNFAMNASTINTTGNWTNSGSEITGGACAVTVAGNITRSGGSMSASTGNFSLGGNFVNNTTGIFNCPLTMTGAAKTISGTNDASFASLSVTGSVTMNTSSSCSSFTIPANATATSLSLASGITLTVNGNVIIGQPTAAVVAALNVNAGTVIVNGDVSIGNTNTTTSRISRIAITTGTLDINGNLIFNSANTTAATAVIDNSGGAGFVYLSGNLTLTNGSGTLNSGSAGEFIYDGAADQTIQDGSAIYYNTLVVSKPSGTVTLLSNLSVGGNLRIENGTFNTSTNNYSLTAINYTLNGGSLVLNNSAMTATGNYTNNGTAVSGGTCSFTVSGDYTRNGGTNSFSNYTVSIGGNFTNNVSSPFTATTTTLTGTSKVISGTYPITLQALSITSGTITANTNVSCTGLTFTNNAAANSLTVASGITFTINGDVTINQATATVVHALNVNSGTVTVNGNINFNVTANNSGRTTRIAITTGTLNVNGNITMNNTLQAANSIIDMVGGAGNLNITGSFTVASLGTLTPGTTSTFNYNGSGDQSIAGGGAITYNSLRINKATGTASLSGNLSLTGDFIMDNGTFSTTSNNYSLTANNYILNGGALVLNSSNLTANGNYTNNGTAISGNTCSMTVAGDFTRNGSTNTITNYTVSLGGNFINNVSSAFAANSTTFTGTSKTISGTFPASFQAINITTGSITLTVDASCTSLTLANNNVANSFTVNDGKTFTVNGNVVINQSSGSTVVHAFNVNGGTATVTGDVTINVTANNSGRVAKIATTSGTLSIGGTLTINNTFLAANALIDMSGGAGTLNLAGNTNVNTLATFTSGSSSAVNFIGSGTQTIPAFSYNNITSSNTGARTLASTGIITIAGTFTAGTNSYTTTGSTVDFSSAGAQTIPAINYNNLICSSTGARTLSPTGTIGIAGTFTPGTNSYTITGSTIDFNGSVSQTIPAINYNNLTSSNTGARTLASTGTIGIAGSFTPGSNAYTTTGSTVNFNGASQTVPAFAYRDLICSGSGIKSYSSGTSSIAYLTVAAGVTLEQSGGTISTNSTASTINGTFSQTGGTLLSATTFTVSTGGVINQSGGLIHLASATGSNPSDNLVIASGGTINQTGGTLHIKDFNASAGTFNQNGSTAVFKVFHDWKPGANSTFNSTLGTVQFTGSGGGGPNFSVGTKQFNNIVVDAGVDPVFYNEVASTIPISGNFTNNNATLGSGISTLANATFTFNGTGAQTITDASSSAVFGHMVVNKASGTLSLASNTNFVGNLTITSGTYNLSTYTCNRTAAGGTLTISDGAKLIVGGNAGGQTGSNFPLNVTSTLAASSTVEYNGSNAITQTIFATPTYGHLTITNGSGSGSATKNTIANITVNGDLAINAGAVLSPAAANTVGGSGTLTGAGTAQVTRTAATPDFLSQYTISNRTLTNLTVDYNATLAQTVSAINYGNLTTSGARTTNSITFASTGTIGIAGVFSPTATYTTGGRIMTGSTIDFNGSAAQTIPAIAYNNVVTSGAGSTKTAAGALVINGSLTTNANVTLDMATFDLGGTLGTITNNGLIKTSSSSSTALPTGRTWSGTVEYYKAAGGQTIVTGVYNNLTNSNTSGSNSVTADLVVNGVLTLNESCTLDMVTYALSGSLTSVAGTGSIQTQNISATPIPVGKTWTGRIQYNSSAAQTIVHGNYTNLDATGGNRTFSTSGTIGIGGTFTPGAGTYTISNSHVDFNGAAAQTIPSFTFYQLSASGGAAKSLGGSVVIQDAIRVSDNTTLALGANNITLKSDSLTTARVGQIASTASITYGTGRFVVERFIPGRRKYRLLTSSVTTSPNAALTVGEEAQSIWGNWQNAGVNTSQSIGTSITGGTSADGYDQQTSNASMFTYDAVNKRYVGFTSANNKNTKYTPLKAGIPYYIFVYGDRQNSTTASNPRSTILKSTGTILTGDQTYNTTSALPLANVVGRFTMMGNPYACTIDWKSVTKLNVSKTIWGWDANLSSTGAYVTVTATAAGAIVSPVSDQVKISRYIQPGQAFFVQTTGANPQVVISESDKVDSVARIKNRVFRTGNIEENPQPLIAVNLLYSSAGTKILADGVVAAFDPSFSNEVTDEDGPKMTTSAEAISIMNGTSLLGIDARPAPANNDAIALCVSRLTKPQYTLQIFGNKLESTNLQAFLADSYLQTVTPLSLTDTNNIVFNINVADAASTNINRFKILFKESGVLPVTFTTVSAVEKDKKIQVEWKVASESGVQRYEVEYSIDGTTFNKKAEAAVKGNNNSVETYTWLDVNGSGGNNYYRIKSVHADGTFSYSKTAIVKLEGMGSAITVYPNPVKNQVINLQFSQVEKGSYSLLIFNSEGRQVFNKVIEHSGGSANRAFSLEKKWPGGIYYLEIKNQIIEHSQTLYVE